MESNSINSGTRTKYLIIAVLFLISNIVAVFLVFRTDFFTTLELDRQILSIRFFFIVVGISFALFFLVFKFMHKLTINRIFLLIVIVHILFFVYITVFGHAPEIDFDNYRSIGEHVLAGDLFTPYGNLVQDWWRVIPPVWMWWYTYNYWLHQLNLLVYRLICLILDIAILYVMIRIFQENSESEKGWTEQNFKIGLSFYAFSFIPIIGMILWVDLATFAVFLAILGFLFYFRSKREPQNIYIAIFFFTLCALTELFAIVWIYAILVSFLFRKEFKRFIFIGIEIIVIFCIVSLPMLINDAINYLRNLAIGLVIFNEGWDGTIWTTDNMFLNVIPWILAIALSTLYIYQNRDRDLNLNFFIVSICLFLFFTPYFAPWHYLWIFPLISINLIYSFKKYFKANLFFIGYFWVYMVIFALAFLAFPEAVPPLKEIAWNWTIAYMNNSYHFIVLQLCGHLFFQIGLIYLIYSYTGSKRWIYPMVISFCVFYTINILIYI